MVRELAAERALDDGFLESADRGLELLVRDRSLADKLVENLGRDRRQRRLRTLAFRFAVHSHPSCYAPHTKFLTPSGPAFPRIQSRNSILQFNPPVQSPSSIPNSITRLPDYPITRFIYQLRRRVPPRALWGQAQSCPAPRGSLRVDRDAEATKYRGPGR